MRVERGLYQLTRPSRWVDGSRRTPIGIMGATREDSKTRLDSPLRSEVCFGQNRDRNKRSLVETNRVARMKAEDNSPSHPPSFPPALFRPWPWPGDTRYAHYLFSEQNRDREQGSRWVGRMFSSAMITPLSQEEARLPSSLAWLVTPEMPILFTRLFPRDVIDATDQAQRLYWQGEGRAGLVIRDPRGIPPLFSRWEDDHPATP